MAKCFVNARPDEGGSGGSDEEDELQSQLLMWDIETFA
jgi:hypothetical protein